MPDAAAPRSRRRWLWLALGLAHLTIAIAGAIDDDWLRGDFLAPIREYGFWSGAVAHVKFFAPGVGSQLRLTYSGTGPGGAKLEGDVITGRAETDLRIAKIVDFFWGRYATDDLRASLAASWAGKLLGLHPDLDEIEIRLDSFVLPGMASFRAGEKTGWASYYEARFRREGESLRSTGESR